MKDIRGREIQVGNHVVYIRSMRGRNFEEGIVVACHDGYVKIDYMGRGDGVFAAKTRRGTVTATEKKVIILNTAKADTSLFEALNRERIEFKVEIQKLENQLFQSLQREIALQAKIDMLIAEADRVNNRWDILDLENHST